MPSIPLGEAPWGSCERAEQCPDPEGDPPPPPPGGTRSPAGWSELEARTVPSVPNNFVASDGRILPLLCPEEEQHPPALQGRVGGVCTPLSQPAGMQADGVAGEGHQPVTTLLGLGTPGFFGDLFSCRVSVMGTSAPLRARTPRAPLSYRPPGDPPRAHQQAGAPLCCWP